MVSYMQAEYMHSYMQSFTQFYYDLDRTLSVVRNDMNSSIFFVKKKFSANGSLDQTAQKGRKMGNVMTTLQPR